METPSVFLLNLRGIDWLEEEAARWFTIYANATGQDKIDAKAYLDQVLAERDQRLKQYGGGVVGAAKAGATAIFETLGGSAGAGASGLSTSVAVGVKEGAKIAATGAQTVLVAATLVAVVVGGIWAYGGRKRAAA